MLGEEVGHASVDNRISRRLARKRGGSVGLRGPTDRQTDRQTDRIALKVATVGEIQDRADMYTLATQEKHD